MRRAGLLCWSSSGSTVVSVGRSVGVMDDVVARACEVASVRLRGLTRRLAHVQGVASRAAEVVAALAVPEAAEVVAAAWLHDVGYAPDVAVTGFHPVDGARLAAALGFSPLAVSLIAHHTGAAVEARERGLTDALSEFPVPPEELLDVVTFADLTTSPTGEPIDAADRIAEILGRYSADDPVHRAVTASAPSLLATVARVNGRLRDIAARGAGQPR